MEWVAQICHNHTVLHGIDVEVEVEVDVDCSSTGVVEDSMKVDGLEKFETGVVGDNMKVDGLEEFECALVEYSILVFQPQAAQTGA